MKNHIRKNRVFSFCLILAICLSIFTGCGESDLITSSQISTDTKQTIQNRQLEQTESTVSSKVEKKSKTNQHTEKQTSKKTEKNSKTEKSKQEAIKLSDIPEYNGNAYITLNKNEPNFSSSDKKRTDAFETYSELDTLGRCQVAYANICKELMPETKREGIGQVKPTGWHTVKYDCVDGKYLYNRCHLIGYQLAGENANEKNLITGTRYLNTKGMLPFENMVADYVKETNYHVLYRVTPVFEGDNLVAKGVEMEAWSVEDQGEGIAFHVFVYNVQPGICIDYATGNSYEQAENQAKTEKQTTTKVNQSIKNTAQSSNDSYILNVNSKKFHKPSCRTVKQMSKANQKQYQGNRDELIKQGYDACKICNP